MAPRGDESAQYELARPYAAGDEIAPDPARAKHWFGQAAAQGHAESAHRLAELVARDGANAS